MPKDDYDIFLVNKNRRIRECGIKTKRRYFPKCIFKFQSDVVAWALRKGRAAIFADTGLGKTLMELAWANTLYKERSAKILILAPLAVAHQFVREANKFSVDIHFCVDANKVSKGINITNYEKIHKFDLNEFDAIILDESSILKSYDGKIRNQLIDVCENIPYKLACTATPSPNDFMELGNHSEFLGVAKYTDMLSTYFVHDGGDTAKWRLKGHAEEEFWRWVCDWSVMFRHPRDLGYDMTEFDLPELIEHFHFVNTKHDNSNGEFFPTAAHTLAERIKARRSSIDDRIQKAVDVTPDDVPFVWWCNLNAESEKLSALIPDAVELTGSDSDRSKVDKLENFAKGNIRVLVTKTLICGYGLNWQHCCNTGFVGVTDSYEQTYQAVRRFWRFGQTSDVTVHYISSDVERAVLANVRKKFENAEKMRQGMLKTMTALSELSIRNRISESFIPDHKSFNLPRWLDV